ncbi:thiamine-monophosphate kinase [Candidatus Magnetominusculus xianensis]|uniref:Thiamine-monophosphate kinase n=2 Tax=Candidatus Magnetominusculus xianensis TaxID=1748249 RepID=A0ABR5SJX8_9BACT|nr:thiamine-monophosphate kinase [Candidatus Magnetominusculus xianensis]
MGSDDSIGGQVGELALVKYIRDEFGAGLLKDLTIGIGDDAAVLKVGGRNLLISADTMCEGVHFDLAFATAYQVGFKLVSVNVSDIYAMGGAPEWFLLTTSLSSGTSATSATSDRFAREFLSGVKAALNLYGAALIGGDVTSSRSGIVLTGIVLGGAKSPISRKGARAGDKIYVSGVLGDSACGLELLKKIMAPVAPEKDDGPNKPLPWEIMRPLITRHLMPKVIQQDFGTATVSAMMDISDGLSLDLRRLCQESGVGAAIYENNIPMSAQMTTAAGFLNKDPLKFSLCGGEDYEYLFTSADKIDTAHYIGDITDSGLVFIGKDGRQMDLMDCGYEHFKT